MALFKTHIGLFYDARGEYCGSKTYNPTKDSFSFKEGRYIIDEKNSSVLEVNVFPFPLGWLWIKYKVDYNIKRSHPILKDNKEQATDGKGHPVISPSDFNTIYESKVAKDLNTAGFNINWKIIVGALIGIGILIWLITSHKI